MTVDLIHKARERQYAEAVKPNNDRNTLNEGQKPHHAL